MDSAGTDQVRTALAQQGALLGQHATQLTTTSRELEMLSAQVVELNARIESLQHEAAGPRQVAPPIATHHHDPEPHANNPPPYDGDTSSCRAFLSQCGLVFALQPRRYATEASRVAYVLTLLTGRAREWGTAVWDARAPFCRFFDDFKDEMIKLFDRSAQGDEAAARLARLTQEGRSVTDYSIMFNTLAATCDWNEGALRSRFFEGLNEEIQDEIASHELPRHLETLIDLALRVEGRLRRRRQWRSVHSSWRADDIFPQQASSTPSSSDPEPMQMGRMHLTPQEKRDRLARGVCLYCGKPGHFAIKCPLKARAHQ